MIEVKDLTKYYGGTLGVEKVSFRVEKGEIVGLLGPNAAGKTTTIRILTCFLPATSGEAQVDGYDVFTQSLEVKRRIGYLPENVPLYQEMRVREYLAYRARIKEVPRVQQRKRIERVIEQCWIGDVSDRIIGQLSKGYKQRVGLAGTLISDPKILILDEPTIGLDPNQIRQVRKLIKDLGGDYTILLSSHILPEVEMVCGRVLIIDRGKIVAMDSPERLMQRVKGGVSISLEVRGPGQEINDKISRIPGVAKIVWEEKGEVNRYHIEFERDKDLREEISRVVFSSGGTIREMRKEALSLEDIFVHITTREQS